LSSPELSEVNREIHPSVNRYWFLAFCMEVRLNIHG